MRIPLLMLLLAAVGAHAQTEPKKDSKAPTELDKVEVDVKSTDESKRRAATASKIVITREDLLRFGDGNLADLLRRLPGVTPGGRPGRGGEIRMRGMGGGFTQILVDGERMAPGFSIDQIPPEQVERIEIQRAPTAETGARAIAGTINIVLREPLAKKLNELRASLGLDHGHWQPNLAWTRNDSFSPALNYSLTTVLNSQRRADDIDTQVRLIPDDGSPAQLRTQRGESLDRRDSLNVNARLAWRLGEGESLTLMPFFVVAKGENDSRYAQTGEPRYQAVQTHGDGHFHMLRAGAMYMRKLGEDVRLDLRANGGRTELRNDSTRLESGGSQDRRQDDHVSNRDDNLHLNTKLSVQTASEHAWVSGAEFEWGQRDNTRTSLQNGAPLVGLGDFGDQLSARTLRGAVYTQDEWQANPQWNLHAGLRYEQIDSRGQAGAALGEVHNVSRVLSPLLHALWKPEPKSRDQLRMSLTRSYRAASLNDLIARPVFNSQFPSGPNTEYAPDSAGNPYLKPELATGLELAWEHYLSRGGLMSANLFARDIRGLIRRTLTLEDTQLNGADVQRWVSRPRNLGNARTYGLELEAKARVDELFDEVPAALVPLQLRANLSLFSSKVDGIPGPHNRIDAQPRFTSNLGLDYRLPGGDWSLGANWSYTPEILIQQTEILTSRTSKRVVFDAYAAYRVNASFSLRLNLSNLDPLDALSQTVVDSGSNLVVTDDRKRSFRTATLRAELRF